MKCKVIKAYVDQYDLIEHAVGDEVEVTKERAKELEGYIENEASQKKKNKNE